jgi:hypothetical protein
VGKKSTKTNSTTTSMPPAFATPIIQGGSNAVLDNFKANQGNLQGLESGLTGSIIPGLQSKVGDTSTLTPGTSYISNTLGDNPGNANPANAYLSGSLGSDFLNANPANSYLTSQANGDFLNANPYTQALAKQAGQAAGNAVNSTFSAAGRTGSGNHATDLARGVDQAQNNVYFQNYQNERNLQNQAIGQLGQNYNTSLGLQQNAANMLGSNYNTGLGIQSQAASMLPNYQASQYSGYTPLLGATQLAGQLPYYGANSLGTIGSLLGSYGTQTSTGQQPGGWLNGLLGAGASLGTAAILASDRRLKTNIELEFRAPDGLGWYSWNWKSNPKGEREHGVIADEVERLRPHAFVKGFVNGIYDGVNYAALGEM